MLFARPLSAPISLKMRDKKIKDTIFCENNYSESLKLPVDYSPVNFIVRSILKVMFITLLDKTFTENIFVLTYFFPHRWKGRFLPCQVGENLFINSGYSITGQVQVPEAGEGGHG